MNWTWSIRRYTKGESFKVYMNIVVNIQHIKVIRDALGRWLCEILTLYIQLGVPCELCPVRSFSEYKKDFSIHFISLVCINPLRRWLMN